jgi:hypothetical protein
VDEGVFKWMVGFRRVFSDLLYTKIQGKTPSTIPANKTHQTEYAKGLNMNIPLYFKI